MEDVKEVVETVATDAPAQEQEKQQNAFMKFINSFMGKDKVPEEPEGQPKAEETAKPEENKLPTFDQEAVQRMISEERQKWESEVAEKERLKKLSPEEREKEEKSSLQQQLDQMRKDMLVNDLKSSAISSLSNDGYPVKLVDCFDFNKFKDVNEMQQALTGVVDAFKDAVKQALTDKLKVETPQGLNTQTKTTSTFNQQIADAVKGGF